MHRYVKWLTIVCVALLAIVALAVIVRIHASGTMGMSEIILIAGMAGSVLSLGVLLICVFNMKDEESSTKTYENMFRKDDHH